MMRRSALGLCNCARCTDQSCFAGSGRWITPANAAIAQSPASFIAAWRRVYRIFAQVGATNVRWVWCPTGWGFGKGLAERFYPGSAYVDWIRAAVTTGLLSARCPGGPSLRFLLPFISGALRPANRFSLVNSVSLNGRQGRRPPGLRRRNVSFRCSFRQSAQLSTSTLTARTLRSISILTGK